MYRQIDDDLKTALKNGDKTEVMVLRALKSAFGNARIDKGEDLDEADYIKVLEKEAKQRRESIESYTSAGQTERAEQEEKELEIIERYLPQALTDAELEKLVLDAIAEVGATHIGDMGSVMKVLQPRIAGRADGGEAAEKVRQQLQ